jgi:hypothetical protein
MTGLVEGEAFLFQHSCCALCAHVCCLPTLHLCIHPTGRVVFPLGLEPDGRLRVRDASGTESLLTAEYLY